MNEAKANRMLEILLEKGYTDWPNLKGRSRVREVNDVRQICMWIIRHGTSMSLHNIGAIFVRHHATILHAIEHVDNMIQTDSIYRSKVEQMLSHLDNEHLNKVFYKLIQ
jgi:chromosomal replication initiator protein